MHFNSYEYLSAAPFLEGRRTRLTKQVSLALEPKQRQLLPEITGSSFSKSRPVFWESMHIN